MTKHKKKPEKPKEDNKTGFVDSKDKKSFEDKDSKIKELTETTQRLQAEFENYKKRVEKEKSEFSKCANQDLIKQLLPFIDDFELALKNCRAKDDFYKGIELIYSHLIEALHSQGLKQIDCIGKKFDPYYHEALMTEESDKQENIILEEMQKGYMLNDKVIRHSKVKVSKKPSAGPKLNTENLSNNKAIDKKENSKETGNDKANA